MDEFERLLLPPSKEEELVEEEFREKPGDEFDWEEKKKKPKDYTSEEVRAAEAKAEVEKRKFELEREALERKERSSTREEKKSEEKWKRYRQEEGAKRRERVKKEVAGYARGAQKALTLGGMPAMKQQQTKRFYMGSPERSLYEPGAPSTAPLRESPAGMALAPDLEETRKLSQLGKPNVRKLGSESSRELVTPPKYLRMAPAPDLRAESMPRGLSPIEKKAFSEIRANGDRDTLAHVQDELRKLNIPRSQTALAIRGLEGKGIVTRAHDRVGEPPIYEVSRR